MPWGSGPKILQILFLLNYILSIKFLGKFEYPHDFADSLVHPLLRANAPKSLQKRLHGGLQILLQTCVQVNLDEKIIL